MKSIFGPRCSRAPDLKVPDTVFASALKIPRENYTVLCSGSSKLRLNLQGLFAKLVEFAGLRGTTAPLPEVAVQVL